MNKQISKHRRSTNQSKKGSRQARLTKNLNEQLRNTFNQIIKDIEKIAIQKPESIKKAFYNFYGDYDQLCFLIRLHHYYIKPIILSLDQNLYGLRERDFFIALSPATQQLLKAQGVNYEESISN